VKIILLSLVAGVAISASMSFGEAQLVADSQSLKVSNNNSVSFERGSYEIVKAKVDRSSQLSKKELEKILRIAGFDDSNIDMAIAIVYYESTFRPMSLNRSSNCYGLFQINMSGSLGESRRKKYGLSSNEDLFNPVINASIAYKMSNGGKNWSAWTTKDLAESKVNS